MVGVSSRRDRSRTDSETFEGIVLLVAEPLQGIGQATAEELGRHGAGVIVHGRDTGRRVRSGRPDHHGGAENPFRRRRSWRSGADRPPRRAGRRGRCPGQQRRSSPGVRADRGPGCGDTRPALCRERPGGVLPRRRLGSEDGRPRKLAQHRPAWAAWPGQIGLAGSAAYGTTKATVIAMTRSWAAEFGPAGVEVVPSLPGPVLTAVAAPRRTEDFVTHDPAGPATRPQRDRQRSSPSSPRRRPATRLPARSSPPTVATTPRS